MMMDITFLGTGGGMPMVNRFLSSMLINYNGRKILVDCGEGTQVAMRKVNAGFKSVDIICITHFHGDHILGLPGLLSTIGNCGREEKITIIGPEGIKNVVKGLNVINTYLPYDIQIIECSEDEIVINNQYIKGEMIIKTIPLDHSSSCIGYSFYLERKAEFLVKKAILNDVPKALWSKLQKDVEEIEYNNKIYTRGMVLGEKRKGIKLTYITDTRPIKQIIDFTKYSDLFVCEGTYGDDLDLEKAIKNKHMTFREAAFLAKNAEARSLILTHFSTAMGCPMDFLPNAKVIFDKSIVATEGMKTSLTFENITVGID